MSGLRSVDEETVVGDDTAGAAPVYKRIRWGCVLGVTLPIIVVNCGWIVNSEVRNNLTETTVSSLFMGVVFFLFLITAINLGVRRVFGAERALNQPELMAVYTLLSMSNAIAGVSHLGFLPLFLGSIFWDAQQNPEWHSIWPFLPSYIGPRDTHILSGFYNGNSTFFRPEVIRAWSGPLVTWGVFLVVLLWTLLCLSVMVRRRWADDEHLPFPVIALPLQMTDEKAPLYRSKLCWAGFAIPFFFHSLNTVASLNPAVPTARMNSWNDIATNFTFPWNGVGSILLMLHPVGVGFGYLLGTEVSFSLWFFYFLKKALYVLGVATGWRQPGGDFSGDSVDQFPYTSYQGWGATLALALSALWAGRGYFRAYWQRALHGDPGGLDAHEPMSARMAICGFVGGFLALTAFSCTAGGSPLLPMAFLALYTLGMLALSRLRAETAVLMGGLSLFPQQFLFTIVGTQNLSHLDLTRVGMLTWFNNDYRSTAMPQELEGMVGLQRSGGRMRPLVAAILVTSVVAIVSALLWEMQMYYVNGAESARVVSWRNDSVVHNWQLIATNMHNPQRPETAALLAMLAGAAVTFLLAALRAQFVGFPLHPSGFVLNAAGANEFFWFDMFVAWAVKSCMLRYGGLTMYRAALPFFLGLILGDFFTGAAWCLFGTVMHLNLFRTFPV